MPDSIVTLLSDELIPPSFIYDSQHTSPVREASHSDGGSPQATSNGRRHKPRRYQRERELAQKSHAELVRLIVSQEKETAKLQRTLSETLQLLQQERERLAGYDEEIKNIVQRSQMFNENLEKARVEENEAMRELRLVQFRLDNAEQDIIRLQEELEIARRQKVQAEEEAARARTQAWDHRRHRLIEAAREEGRRAGFEDGFKKAQAESPLHQQRVNPAPGTPFPANSTTVENFTSQPHQNVTDYRDDNDGIYDELSSISVIDPPQNSNPVAMPPGITIGSLNTNHKTRKIPERNIPTPGVDSYSISVPPADAMRTYPRRHEWVTGAQHRQINGQTPPFPSTPLEPEDSHHNRSSSAPQPTSVDEAAVQQMPRSREKGVKFTGPRVRRATLAAKTKDKAASWYRSLSFRKKPKRKPLIDPIQEEDAQLPPESSMQMAPSGTTLVPSMQEPGLEANPPQQSQELPTQHQFDDSQTQEGEPSSSVRQSKAGRSVSSGVRAKDFAYSHNPANVSRHTVSTHISDLELVGGPGGSQTRIRPPGSAANSITGRSTKSAKPSVGASSHPTRVVGSGRTRFFETGSIAGTMNDEKRSVKSRRSGRLVAVNPDPLAEDTSNEGKQKASPSPYPWFDDSAYDLSKSMAHSPLYGSSANPTSMTLQRRPVPHVDPLNPSVERLSTERISLSNNDPLNSRSPQVSGAVPHGMPKIFHAQGLSQNPGSPSRSMAENRAHSRSASDSAAMLLNQGQKSPEMNATVYLSPKAGIQRTASNTSLRSQGSFGKFDPNTYEDPAIWAAPPGAFAKINGREAGTSSIRPKPSVSSSHLSYASK